MTMMITMMMVMMMMMIMIMKKKRRKEKPMRNHKNDADHHDDRHDHDHDDDLFCHVVMICTLVQLTCHQHALPGRTFFYTDDWGSLRSSQLSRLGSAKKGAYMFKHMIHFSWQAQYLARMEGDICCSTQCK